jgi:hypothetical protein
MLDVAPTQPERGWPESNYKSSFPSCSLVVVVVFFYSISFFMAGFVAVVVSPSLHAARGHLGYKCEMRRCSTIGATTKINRIILGDGSHTPQLGVFVEEKLVDFGNMGRENGRLAVKQQNVQQDCKKSFIV